MFKEVSQTSLVLFFLYGANTLYDIEVGTLLGPVVMAYVILKAIIQSPYSYSRVYRQRLRQISRLCHGGQNDETKQCPPKEMFHSCDGVSRTAPQPKCRAVVTYAI